MIKIQSISDLITNSSSEVFVMYTKEGIESFKEIISTLIGEDFDKRFNLEVYCNEHAIDEYAKSGSDLSFEDWCFERDQNNWEGYTYVHGFGITARDPEYVNQANALNQIYSLFESEERYC